MKHFKTWKTSESHLPTSQKWFIYYNVYKYSTKTKCITANLSCQWAKWNEKLSQFARWKSLSRTSLRHEDWKWIETTPLGFLFVYDLNFHYIYMAIRFRALFQDQSKGNTCGSTVTKLSQQVKEIMVSECKKQACNPAAKANEFHHIYSILPRTAYMELWLW